MRLAGGGKAVLLAERGALGGTCINIGCTPTKTLLATALLPPASGEPTSTEVTGARASS
jgi:mercuric reductase